MPTEVFSVDFDNPTGSNKVNAAVFTDYPSLERCVDEGGSVGWGIHVDDYLFASNAGGDYPVVCWDAALDSDQYSEVIVSATFPSGGPWGGPATRCISNADAIVNGDTEGSCIAVRFRVNGDVRTATVSRVDPDGTVTSLGTFSPGGLPSESVLRMEAEGSDFRVYLNGSLQTTVTDANFASGKAGLHSWSSGGFDIFRGGNLASASTTNMREGSTTITKAYVGSTEITRIYTGSTIIHDV